jgi:hypothetical protein
MLTTEEVLRVPAEDRVAEDLTTPTLTEPSKLYLHGFGDEFPDSVVCAYCGKPLKGKFVGAAFVQECDCDDFQAELLAREEFEIASGRVQMRLNILAERAKRASARFIELNKSQYLSKRKEVLMREIGDISTFDGSETK